VSLVQIGHVGFDAGVVSGSSSTSWREAWARESVAFASFLNDSQAGENQVPELLPSDMWPMTAASVSMFDEGPGGRGYDRVWLEYIGHEIIDGLSIKYSKAN